MWIQFFVVLVSIENMSQKKNKLSVLLVSGLISMFGM
jgi:hypothetical protein